MTGKLIPLKNGFFFFYKGGIPSERRVSKPELWATKKKAVQASAKRNFYEDLKEDKLYDTQEES